MANNVGENPMVLGAEPGDVGCYALGKSKLRGSMARKIISWIILGFATAVFAGLLAAEPGIPANGMPNPSLALAGQTGGTTTYTVTWTWIAPTPLPAGVTIAGYNVFRDNTAVSGTCPTAGASNYTQANTALVTGLSFIDPATIAANSQECVYIVAVSTVGVAGVPSAPFLLNTTAPGAPTGPTPSLSPSA
jgi:hypothetical protein